MKAYFPFIGIATAAMVGVSSPLYAYSLSVDRFSVTGNLPVDQTEDFDNGELAPWIVYDPTVVESNSTATFSTPGSRSPFIGDLEREYSYIYNDTGTFSIQDGSGDFRAESVWTSGLPAQDEVFVMNFWSGSPDPDVGTDVLSFFLANVSAEMASMTGLPQGYSASAFSDYYGYFLAGNVLNPADLSGDIHLALDFDDANDAFSASVSLDGGNSYTQALSAQVTGWGQGYWFLGAEAWRPVPTPATVILFLAGLPAFAYRWGRSCRGQDNGGGSVAMCGR